MRTSLINTIAERHGLPVIEDAAQSFGGELNGARSCSMTTIGCTSFFPAKPLGCYGDGGACFTNDAALATRLRELRNHGQDRRYHHPRVGINGRMDTLQAAIILSKMTLFPDEVRKRAALGQRYSEILAGADCSTPHIADGNLSVYAQYTLRVVDRERLAAKLAEKGIPTAVHYPITLDQQPALAARSRSAGALEVASRAAREVISLPMHPYLEDVDLERVCSAVYEALES
jgi:UDP-2-acetamido-2-deoxy-ribo-hexuluronate aminotransferase